MENRQTLARHRFEERQLTFPLMISFIVISSYSETGLSGDGHRDWSGEAKALVEASCVPLITDGRADSDTGDSGGELVVGVECVYETELPAGYGFFRNQNRCSFTAFLFCALFIFSST